MKSARLSPIYHNDKMIYDALVRLKTTEVNVLEPDCGFHSFTFETFTQPENVLTTCTRTTADPEHGRTREGAMTMMLANQRTDGRGGEG